MALANRDLMEALSEEYEPWLLTSDRRTLRLWRADASPAVQVREATLARAVRATDYSRRDYREIVERWLREGAFELVHIRHLFKHTFDLPAIAHRLGVPLIVSFHDFYFVCPTIHLLDNEDRYCAGRCTPGEGHCRIPEAGLEKLPHLKHAYVHQWREEAVAALRHADALVTTSPHARSVHRGALPGLAAVPFEVIAHGRALRQHATLARAPGPEEPVRVLVIANLDVHKGSDYLRAMRAAPGGKRLELHLLGSARPADEDLGVLHGPFERERLAEHVASIRPAFAGCFSIVAETWSHTLTEAWALGLPVVATDLGALGERVRAHGGGVLVPVDDPELAVSRILELAADPVAWGALRDAATVDGCPSLEAMADAYVDLYRRSRDRHRPLAAPADAPVPLRRRHGGARMLALVAGADGVHPGSVFVRVLRRWRHPGVSDTVSLRLRAPEDDPVRPETDVVLLQRTALEPELTRPLIDTLAERGIPLLLDLDDDLLDPDRPEPLSAAHRQALLEALAAAALVLVPHDRLARALGPHTRAVAVVPNLIDERLFLSGVKERPRADPAAPGRTGRVELVYIGSPTHGRDLALLVAVLAALEEIAPDRFALTVVGGERPGPGQEWYRRRHVPDDRKPYPAFVGWLREQRPAWDIALAPLCDTPFNRHKSDLKHLEYSALGLPAVYSDLEPYASVVDGETGLRAAAHDPAAWARAVRNLADSGGPAQSIADRAFERVCAERLVSDGSQRLLEVLGSVLGPAGGVCDDGPR
jgi:glycosyltransferase involved in cell wall biosynthesis